MKGKALKNLYLEEELSKPPKQSDSSVWGNTICRKPVNRLFFKKKLWLI